MLSALQLRREKDAITVLVSRMRNRPRLPKRNLSLDLPLFLFPLQFQFRTGGTALPHPHRGTRDCAWGRLELGR